MAVSQEIAELGADIVRAAFLKGDFVLSSGRRSNYYFDKYLFETQPSILKRLGQHLAKLVPPETQLLAAPELGAVLLGAAVSMELGLPLTLVRKDSKEYGTTKLLEGTAPKQDQRVTVIEDILTTGGQALGAAQKLRAVGANVIHLVAVVDREEGADTSFAAANLPFTPLFRKSDLNLPE